MNRRTFFGRLTAGVAGIGLLAKGTHSAGQPDPAEMTISASGKDLAKFQVPSNARIVGIALQDADENEPVAVAVVSHNLQLNARAVAESRVRMGEYLTSTPEGRVAPARFAQRELFMKSRPPA